MKKSLSHLEALRAYLALGPNRTIEGLRQALSDAMGAKAAPSRVTLQRWSQKGAWREKAEEHDSASTKEAVAIEIEASTEAKATALANLREVATISIRLGLVSLRQIEDTLNNPDVPATVKDGIRMAMTNTGIAKDLTKNAIEAFKQTAVMEGGYSDRIKTDVEHSGEVKTRDPVFARYGEKAADARDKAKPVVH